MFLITDYRPEELDTLRAREFISPGQSYSDFKMDVPVQVEFISLRPEDDLEYFTMASTIPEHIYHVALSKEEIGARLAQNIQHRHSYYELSFVLCGTVHQLIENRRHIYTPGSCCLLNRNVLHTEEHDTDFDILFLGISDEVLRDVYRDLTEGFFTVEKERPDTDLDRFLRENLFSDSSYDKQYVDFIPKDNDNAALMRVRALFLSIQDELLSPRIGSTHRIKALIAKLLHLLSDRSIYQTQPIQIGTDAENQLYDQIDRIMQETWGRASRSFLEEELHYSGDYLNKITKKYTGLSIHDFGMTICMGRAAEQLSATDRHIGDIAASLGFSNRTHFYKQFEKVYHMSPAEYRKENRKAPS